MQQRPIFLRPLVLVLLVILAAAVLRFVSKPQNLTATPTTLNSQNTTSVPSPTLSPTTSTSSTQATGLPLKISLEGRSNDNYKLENVKVAIKDAQTGQEITTKDDVSLSYTGEVPIPGNFSADKTYKVTIKAPGFIQIETDAKQNQVTSLPQALVVGDFDGDNKVTVADIVSVIAAHNGANRPEVTKAFGKVPDLPEIVQVIRNSNASH